MQADNRTGVCRSAILCTNASRLPEDDMVDMPGAVVCIRARDCRSASGGPGKMDPKKAIEIPANHWGTMVIKNICPF